MSEEAGPAEPTPSSGWARRFGLVLGAIVVVGVGIRIVYTVQLAPHDEMFYDSYWYYLQAANLRDGRGYIDIYRQLAALSGNTAAAGNFPTAYWPPLYPIFLAGAQSVLGDSVRMTQLAGCATGAATIALTGLLGRAITGRAVGLLAAAIVACSPFLIAVDGSLLSETLSVPLGLLALLLAVHARARPTIPIWCALGATIGLATLARGDSLLLVVFVMIPAALLSPESIRHMLPRLALGLLSLAVVLAPWVVRNAIEVDQPTISTVSANAVFAAANCPKAYGGRGLGYWDFGCIQYQVPPGTTEVSYANALRRRGIDYALDHLDRWPLVATARVARVWGLWDPRELSRVEAVETRHRTWQRLAWPLSLATFVLGLVGIWVLARRDEPIAVLVGVLTMVTTVALVTYGNTRFRAIAEPALAIGAAVAVLAAIRRLRARPAAAVASST